MKAWESREAVKGVAGMEKKALSLNAKILLLTLSTLSAVCLVTFLITEWAMRRNDAASQATISTYREVMNDAIGAQFFERYGDVQAFARNAALRSRDPNVIREALNAYIELYQIYDVIVLVGPNGKLIASSDVKPDGIRLETGALKAKDYARFPWFQESLAERFTEDRDKGFAGTYVSDVAVDPLSSEVYGEKRYGNAFSTLVKDPGGAVIGVLSARANFVWLEKEVVGFYKRLKAGGYPGSELTILDRQGNIIVDYDPVEHRSDNLRHDFDQGLGKLNLAANGVEAAKRIVSGEAGILDDQLHVRKQIGQFAAYGPVDGPKLLGKALGWGALVRIPMSELYAQSHFVRNLSLVLNGVLFIAFLAVAFFIGRRISRQLVAQTESLVEATRIAKSSSESLSQASQQLSASSSEQASAIQETVSAMEEMGSMISQTTRHAGDSASLAAAANEKAEAGRGTMEKMARAMADIQDANAQLGTIIQVINEISSKTNVINDIVFKTQLLSFNASIEAARAGQHGRGFAVVAEEVGNLAQVSGKSAREITELLDKSKLQVDGIVQNTSTRVKEGHKISEEALESFREIAENIKLISGKVADINQAASEQESGVKQTSVAITQMDVSARKNQEIAGQSASLARNIANQARKLTQIGERLRFHTIGRASSEAAGGGSGDADARREDARGEMQGEAQGDGHAATADWASVPDVHSAAPKQGWRPAEPAEAFTADDPSFKKMT
jgi:methyl-accepting chemotaxis protein